MEIIEYSAAYEEDAKDLLVELQETIAALDREGYNVLTGAYREMYFQAAMGAVNEKNGKVFLAVEHGKAVGMVAGTVAEAERTCAFAAPKSGRITELVVEKSHRARGVGTLLLRRMEEYFVSAGCARALLEVFAYNESAKSFYSGHRYFDRTAEMMKQL